MEKKEQYCRICCRTGLFRCDSRVFRAIASVGIVLYFPFFIFNLSGTQASFGSSRPVAQGQNVQDDRSMTMESVLADGLVNRSVPSATEQFAGPQLYGVSSRYVAWNAGSRSLVSCKVYFPTGIVKPCPIVIFSHGLGGSVETCGYLGKMWASRGIISFHLEHPGSNEQIWRSKIQARDVLRSAYQAHWTGRDRALAIRFVLDRLDEIASGKTSDQAELAHMLDMKKIGVAGNDLGALAALLVAGQLPPDNGSSLKDARVLAVLALSPPVYCNAANAPLVYGGVRVPFMSFSGTLDDGVIGSTKAWQRRIPYDSLSDVDRYHVTLQGADHLVYSGVRPRGRQSQGSKDAVYQKTIMEVSTVFWALYLKNDSLAAVLLKGKSGQTVLQVGVLEKHLGQGGNESKRF